MDYYSTYENIILTVYFNLCVKNTRLEVGFTKMTRHRPRVHRPTDHLPLTHKLTLK